MQRFAASARLTIDQVPGDFNPAELLPAFNTNPAFLQASGHSQSSASVRSKPIFWRKPSARTPVAS